MPRRSRNEAHGNEASLGLTQAFDAVSDDALVDARARRRAHAADDGADGVPMGLTRAFDPVGGAPADDGDDWMPDDDAWAAELGQAPAAPPAPELDDADEAPRGRHGRHGRVPDEAPGKGRKGRKKDAGDEIPAYLRKSRRMRRILIAVAVILVLLLAAGAYFTWQLVQVAETSASQQAQAHQDQQQAAVLSPDEANDASSATTVKKTTVPNLTALLGLDQDQAIEYLAHGAQVASTREVNEEDNPVRQEVRVALTEEPADARTGTPTVYLGLGEDGLIVQVGYSTSTASLGYGSLSFADAVRNESIIEKTLAEAGVDVDEGSVALPEDKESYSTYDTDGKTLIKEYCSFYGEADVEGTPMQWSAVLSYDYTMANATSNLADTVRTIYVYVGA